MSEHLRIGDAERERAAAELGEHYAQGRLSVEEHGERLDQVWAARTYADLRPVFADLPGQHGPARPSEPGRQMSWASPAATRRRRGLPAPLFVALVVVAAVAVLAHLPFLLLGLVAWAVLTGRAGHRGHRHGCRPRVSRY